MFDKNDFIKNSSSIAVPDSEIVVSVESESVASGSSVELLCQEQKTTNLYLLFILFFLIVVWCYSNIVRNFKL